MGMGMEMGMEMATMVMKRTRSIFGHGHENLIHAFGSKCGFDEIGNGDGTDERRHSSMFTFLLSRSHTLIENLRCHALHGMEIAMGYQR